MTGEFISPMLGVPLEIGLPKHENQWRRSEHWPMEPKLDGVRCIAVIHKDGTQLYSRTKHDLTGKVPWEMIEDLFHTFPSGTVLDGELGYVSKGVYYKQFWPILDFNATMRVIGSGEAEAQAKIANDSERHLQFWVFDLLHTPEESLVDRTDTLRRLYLEELFKTGPSALWSHVQLVPRVAAWHETIYDQYVAQGGEGVMLKNPAAEYYPGKRTTQTWYKVKKFETLDVTIIGFVEGQGKYAGQVGALVFRTPQGVVAKCSGMTDMQRAMFTRDWPSLIGRTMEIRYFGKVGKTGEGIRHPQFIRMRPDKDLT